MKMEFNETERGSQKLQVEHQVYLQQKRILQKDVVSFESDKHRFSRQNQGQRKAMDNLNDMLINQINGGHPLEPQRRQYAQASARIINIVRDLNNRRTLDYLYGIIHNINFQRS